MGNSNWNTRMTLLEKIKDRHDERAWEDFVYYYEKYVFVILDSMQVPVQHSDELCHKIMITLWQRLPDFEYKKDVAQFRTWLCTVVQNQVRNFFRAQNAQKRKTHDYLPEELYEIPCESEIATLAEQEWNAYVADLAWENISPELPDNYREAFEMHLEGKTAAEIAEEYSMLPNTVNVYLMRCREKLKMEIKRLTNELL